MKKNFRFLFNFIILFSFFKPGYFEQLPAVNRLFNMFTIICSIISLVLYLKSNKISKIQILIILYILVLLLSTTINGQDLVYFMTQYIPILGISMYTEYVLKKDSIAFLKSLSALMFIEIFLNSISIFLFPKGMYGTGIYGSYDYFMGYDNYSAETLVIGLGIIFLNSYINNEKITIIPITAAFLMLFSYLTTQPATALIALILELILIICTFTIGKKKELKLVNYKTFLIIWIILFLIIIVFRLQDIFSWLIVDKMNKDLTFTGRTFIWDRCFDYFLTSPVIGNGVINFNLRASLVNIYHAHSTILNVLIEGGIIGIISYFSMIICAGQSLEKSKNKKVKKLISIMFFAIFILKLMDVFKADTIFYVLLIMSYYCKDNIFRKDDNRESITN